jgi:hypothetical protein
MLVSEVIDEIREELNSNSVKLPDSYLLDGINLDYGDVIMDILRVKTDFNFQAEESYTDLVSTTGLTVGQNGYKGEYTFPSDLIRPIRVEISYDGLTWRPTEFYDVASATGSEHDDDGIDPGQWSEARPFVRFERDSFFVRPVNSDTTVTAGIHIWYEKRQVALTTGDTPLFEANFHRILALKGALRAMKKFREEYNLADRNELRGEINRYSERMTEHYKNLFKRSFAIKPRIDNMA